MLPVISEPMAWLTYFIIGVAVSMGLTIALKMVGKQGKAKVKAQA